MSDFHSYAHNHFEYFKKNGQRVNYKKGQLLVRRDEPSPWMFFLESGFVKMMFASQDGTERIYGFGVPGMTFTQSGSFYTLPHIELEFGAHVDCVVWRSSRDKFIEAMKTDLPLLLDWHERIIQNHNMLTERILYSGEKDPRTRTIAWLLGMARYYSIADKNGVRIEMPMTQDLMASFVHLSRERTNKIIHELKSKGIIEVKNHIVFIPDVKRLQEKLNN